MIFHRLFGRPDDDDVAHDLYGEVVAQARRPEFYVSLGVPDTVDGRFDMIAVHAFLLLRRLKREGSEAAAALAQGVFDLMFADMDRNLREMGVSDLSIGRKVKQMTTAFHGRITVYEAGLEETGGTALESALVRNLFRGREPAPPHLAAIAAYVRREAAALDGQAYAALAAGRLVFGEPRLAAEGGAAEGGAAEGGIGDDG
ncbi:MAG: ubiquinol-cytochrome C chaperone family protein [Alphaproteobacteria bacterium]